MGEPAYGTGSWTMTLGGTVLTWVTTRDSVYDVCVCVGVCMYVFLLLQVCVSVCLSVERKNPSSHLAHPPRAVQKATLQWAIHPAGDTQEGI